MKPQINLQKLGVSIIDMQERELVKHSPKSVTRIVANHQAVLQRCAVKDIPVYLVNGHKFGSVHPFLLRALERVRRIIPLKKRANSAFENTDLEDQMYSIGTEILYLMGFNACACVLETADHAIDRGFCIASSTDVIDNRDSQPLRSETDQWYRDRGIYTRSYREVFV